MYPFSSAAAIRSFLDSSVPLERHRLASSLCRTARGGSLQGVSRADRSTSNRVELWALRAIDDREVPDSSPAPVDRGGPQARPLRPITSRTWLSRGRTARLPRRSGHDRAGSLSLAFLDFLVQHLQCVLLTGSEGERPAGRFPAVHRRRGYAEQAGELGDRESALVAQLRHPAARRLEPGRRGAGQTRPPAAGPAASGGPLPSGRRAAVRRVEIDAEDVREIAKRARDPSRPSEQLRCGQCGSTDLATLGLLAAVVGRRRSGVAPPASRGQHGGLS